jgi:hypothetical protein
MSVTEPGSDLMPEVIALLLDALVVALSPLGLAAERRGIAGTPRPSVTTAIIRHVRPWWPRAPMQRS